jgi:uncharacterized protein (DUF433 family)
VTQKRRFKRLISSINPAFEVVLMSEDEDVGFDRVTIDPNVMGGQPCIRGLRIPVVLIVRMVASGKTFKEIIEDYPELEEEDIKQALEFAA